MSADFRLWLHTLHGTVRRGLRPLRLAQMDDAESIAGRLAVLEDVVVAGADQIKHGVPDLVEIHLNELGMYALDCTAQRCLWLPIAFSMIVESAEVPEHEAERNGVVGVFAYGFPIESPAQTWGQVMTSHRSAGDFGQSDVWLVVVTRRCVRGSTKLGGGSSSGRRILESAAETLGTLGAIRSQMSAFEFIEGTLGEGSFGTVCLMKRRHNDSGRGDDTRSVGPQSQIAAKVMTSTASDEEVLVETNYFLAAQGHANIARFVGLFCNPTNGDGSTWTVLMEAHLGGNIKSKVQDDAKFTEQAALKATEHLLHALVHIHDIGIIHRDVKPENVLLAHDGRAVLVDFGVSVHVSEAVRMTDRCGSPGHIAPEILRKYRYGPKSDVFSCGTVLYYMLGGIVPFVGSDFLSALRSNARARVRFPDENFHDVSANCKDMVRLFLEVQPTRRPTSRSALASVVAASAMFGDITLPGAATLGEEDEESPDSAILPNVPASAQVNADDQEAERSALLLPALTSRAEEDAAGVVPESPRQRERRGCAAPSSSSSPARARDCGEVDRNSATLLTESDSSPTASPSSRARPSRLARAWRFVRRVVDGGQDDVCFCDLHSSGSLLLRRSQSE
eukprot:TRINITY_DN8813_c0_g1_i2.p1 TRINITY_DN8813_c0_g1~~TRINITY_DN8813_c0_g1_i2.p1  ORF type:complete len:620 (+),score=62.79 TRINITY_DN8813_c0_g1_i2:31-1890(+)